MKWGMWTPWRKLERKLAVSEAEVKALRRECNLQQRRIDKLLVTLDAYELDEKGKK